MNLASPFSITVVVITVLAFMGLPIGLSMISGSILYLWLAGADMGIVAEQFLNGMYSNYVILAVPLFILAAEFMNVGSMTERLLKFCNVLVGRFRGGLTELCGRPNRRDRCRWPDHPAIDPDDHLFPRFRCVHRLSLSSRHGTGALDGRSANGAGSNHCPA